MKPIQWAYALSVLVGVSATRSWAEPWCHVKFTSTNQTQIQTDYLLKPGYYSREHLEGLAAEDVWVHVSNPEWTGQEKVQLIFVEGPSSQAIDLNYNPQEKRFSSRVLRNFAVMVKRYGPFAGDPQLPDFIHHYGYEIAVVVNGHWLKDPISQSSNFVLNFANYPDYCPNRF